MCFTWFVTNIGFPSFYFVFGLRAYFKVKLTFISYVLLKLYFQYDPEVLLFSISHRINLSFFRVSEYLCSLKRSCNLTLRCGKRGSVIPSSPHHVKEPLDLRTMTGLDKVIPRIFHTTAFFSPTVFKQ